MNNLFKHSLRILSVIALCGALSACAQPSSFANSSFPTYGSQAAVSGQFEPLSIMDY